MLAVDTNVLLRVFVADDALQHAAVKRLLNRAEKAGETILVTIPVLCETLWTLRSRHGLDRAACAAFLDSLLDNRMFVLDQSACVRRALARYRVGGGGLSDYLIHELASASKAQPLYTFDKDLLKEAGFKQP